MFMIICFAILLSYFQCRSLLKLLILMGMENYTIPYRRLEMNYHICPNHRTETFFVELIVYYCKYKNTLKTFLYLLWSENF